LTGPAGVRARWIVMTYDAERTAIDRLTQRLSARFPLLEAAMVARVVRAAHHRFDDHPCKCSNYLAHFGRAIWRFPQPVTNLRRADTAVGDVHEGPM
jgi:hypothetical protein